MPAGACVSAVAAVIGLALGIFGAWARSEGPRASRRLAISKRLSQCLFG